MKTSICLCSAMMVMGCSVDGSQEPDSDPTARINASVTPTLAIDGPPTQFSVEQDVEYSAVFDITGNPDANDDFEVRLKLFCDFLPDPTSLIDAGKLAFHGGTRVSTYVTLRATVLWGSRCKIVKEDVLGSPVVNIVTQLARWRSESLF